MNEDIAAEIQRSLGRIEEGQKRSSEWQATHQIVDDRNSAETQRNLHEIGSRLQALESMGDTVESHGEAIVGIERRMTESEERENLRSATRSRDRMWLKAIFVLLLALASDHFTGQRVSSWIGALFR